MIDGGYVLSCRLASGPLWLGICPFLWWFLLVIFGLFLLHWRSELPCQDKLPEFHCTPILGCIRVLWLVFHPLGLGLNKALCGWNSVKGDSQSATKPMAEYNPDDLIGRTFLLPKNEQGERLRATIKRKIIETPKRLDDQHDNAIEKINFHLYVGQGRAEAIMSYVQILDHLDHQEQHDDLYKFRAITGHQGPISP